MHLVYDEFINITIVVIIISRQYYLSHGIDFPL